MYQNVSWDYPTSPIYQWTEQNPPFVPAVQVAQEIYPLLPTIACIIANVSGALATTSPVRTYCFNTLSQNNWANDAFASLVKMAADLLVVRYRQRQIMDFSPQTIEAVINELLPCYSSALAVNNTMLFNTLPEQLRVPVANNYQTYNEMVRLTREVSGQPGGNPARPQVGYVQPQRAPVASPRAASAIASNTYGSVAPRLITPGQSTTPKAKLMSATHTARPAEPQAPAYVPETSTVVKGETLMDHNKHMMVYGGIQFPTGSKSAAESMERLAKAVEAVPDPAVMPAEDLDYLFEISLDGAIYEIIAKHANDEMLEIKVTTSLIAEIKPVISPVAISVPFNKISDFTTFSDMARFILSYVKSVSGDDAQMQKKQFIWASQVDKIMTGLINDWLTNTMFTTDFIDSFLADAENLPGYIAKKYSTAGISSFNRFQANLMTLVASKAKTADEGRSLNLDFLSDLGAVDYSAIVVPVGVFMITESSVGLNYDISEKIKKVTQSETGRLFILLDKLARIGRANKTARNILVTSDNRRYEFYESGLGENAFHIKEV